MASVAALIADLQSRGIILFLEQGALRYRSPQDALTAADRAAIKTQRDAIIAFLKARDAGMALRAVQGRAGPLMASIAQEMWYRFGGGANEGKPVALNILMLTRFAGVPAAALAGAIRTVVARHETLRSRVRVQGEDLVLSLNPVDGFETEIRDLTGLAPDQAERQMDEDMRPYCAQLTPVEGEWLTHARIYALPGGAAMVAIRCSHIVTDAGSRNIVLDEVRDLVEGKALAPPGITYNRFSLAERDFFDSAQGADLIAYWRQWYAGLPVLHGPDGRELLWGAGTRMVNNFRFPSQVMDRARALAGRLGATPFLVHLTIFSLALARWSASSDVAVRILGDKRTTLELSETVGLMFCADAVRIQVPAEQDFGTILRGIQVEYDAAVALRVPTLHYYAPQMVKPGVEPIDLPNKIPAVFNYFAAGTAREKAQKLAAPDLAADAPWPPQIQRLPPATWTRRSAPVFLHLMDMGVEADASLHYYADVVSAQDQEAFTRQLFAVYDEVLPA